MDVGFLLWNGQIKRLNNSPKQHIDGRGLGHSGRHAIPQNLHQSGVGTCRMGQYLGRRFNSVELVEEHQSAQVLNRVLISSGAWSHGLARGGPERNENIGDHKVESVGMQFNHRGLDGCDNCYFCAKCLRDGTLYDLNMLGVIVDKQNTHVTCVTGRFEGISNRIVW